MNNLTNREEAATNNSPQPLQAANRSKHPEKHVLSQRQKRYDANQRHYQEWLSNGSPDLRDAWVSLCSSARSHEVSNHRLWDIVEIVTKIATIDVVQFGREQTIDLAETGKTIQRLYVEGVEQADALNLLTLNNISMALGLGPDGSQLKPIIFQPRGNEKQYVITRVKHNGNEIECPSGYYFRKREALGKERASDVKKNLPAAIFAGLFLPKRAASNLVRSTGLYPLDFDGVQDIQKTEEIIRKDASVFLDFLSITGSGLKICVRGPIANTGLEYTRLYERLARLKAQQWGLEEDKATKDSCRLCFLAHDPEAYVNWDAVPVTLSELEGMSLEKDNPEESKTKISSSVQTKSKPSIAKVQSKTAPVQADGLPLEIDWGEIPDLNWESIPLAKVLEALRYVRPCEREVWRTCIAALKYGYGEDTFRFADLWSSQDASYKGEDDVRATWDSHNRSEGEKRSTPRSILWMARQKGWNNLKKPGVLLPTRSTSDFCQEAYAVVRPTNDLFLHGGAMAAIEPDEKGVPKIVEVDAVKGIRFFEKHIQFLKRKEDEEGVIPVALSEKQARLLVKGVQPNELPLLKGILRFAPLTNKEGNLETSPPGYNEETAWFNMAKNKVPVVPLAKAVAYLKSLYEDFEFSSPGDRSRALVHPIGVALKLSGIIRGTVPIDFGTANDSQAGKGLRQRVTAAFFNEEAVQIAQNDRGHGSTWETFQTECLSGRTFIQLDNFDDFHSPQMEAFITGNSVSMRSAYGRGRSVDPGNIIVSISSNGLASRRDFALRSWFIAILKRPKDYAFPDFKEGGLVEYVQQNQLWYLGCIYAIIKEWWRLGALRTLERGHSFREFTQVCDWIAQNVLNEAPVMSGHDEATRHYSDGGRVLFSRLWDYLEKDGKLMIPYRAGRLAEFALAKSIAIPGLKGSTPRHEEALAKLIGGVAAGLFQQDEVVNLGRGKIVQRLRNSNLIPEDDDENDGWVPRGGSKMTAQYVFKSQMDADVLRANDPIDQFLNSLIEALGGPKVECVLTTEDISRFYSDLSVDSAGQWMSKIKRRWPENFEHLPQNGEGSRRWRIRWDRSIT